MKSCGWSVLDLALKDRLYVMESSRYPRRQLVFPMDLTAPDYRDVLELVFEKFADLTGLRQEVMRGKIQALHDDVLRLRVTSEDNDTALPLSFAATLVQNTEKLQGEDLYQHHQSLGVPIVHAMDENNRVPATPS